MSVLANQPTVYIGGVSRGGSMNVAVAVAVAVAVGFIDFGSTISHVKRLTYLPYFFLHLMLANFLTLGEEGAGTLS